MSIFPLPLAPLEHYMLADDHVDYPMTFFLRLEFRGRFDRDRAHGALKSALRWHPLLSARIQGCVHDRTARLMWTNSEPCNPSVVWQSPAAQVEFANGPHIDLARETGLRLWFREFDDTTELLVQMHHACCDGLGAIQFIETFLEIYGSSASGSPGSGSPGSGSPGSGSPGSGSPGHASLGESQPPQEWEERHAVRGQVSCGITGCTWREYFVWLGQRLIRIGRFLKTRPTPLVVPRRTVLDGPPAQNEVPSLVSHFFDVAGTARIRAAAKQRNVPSNTLLMRELFLTLDDWNRSRAAEGNSRPLRIVMPVNLREGARERLPAFNAISLAFIDRQPCELANAQTLLEGIDREVGEAKALRSKMALLPALRFLGRFPNGICRRLRACRCLGSAVFSNLGVLFFGSRLLGPDRLVRCGDLVLTKFEAAPPVRRNTIASFAASMYGNALTISLCYDWHCLTPDDGRALLELYVRRLQSSSDV